MNALKYHWYETSLLSQAVLKHVAMVSKDFIFKKSVQGTGSACILPRMTKSMALFHIKSFSCRVTLPLKENFNMWVIFGSHPDCSVGQMGQQVRPTFNPG